MDLKRQVFIPRQHHTLLSDFRKEHQFLLPEASKYLTHIVKEYLRTCSYQGLSQLTRFGIRIDVRKFKRRQRFSHLWSR